MLLRELFKPVTAKAYLIENLTKGAQNVLANPNMIANIAGAMRDDFTLPEQMQIKAKRASDEELANWFVQQLDSLEAGGYQGVRFSQNGQYHMWVANNYIAGRDMWEDIDGLMPKALGEFAALKPRRWPEGYPNAGQPILDPRHAEVGKYQGVKALARYMVTHYNNVLRDIMEKAKQAAGEKWFKDNARSILLADEPEYRLYMFQNWQSTYLHGKGTAFCTFNSRNDLQFRNWSKKYPIFGIVPKELPRIEKGRRNTGDNVLQKFQFDANSGWFNDYADDPADAETIKKHFPYLLDDIEKGLRANKEEIETPAPELVKGTPAEANAANTTSQTKHGAPLDKLAYNVEDTITALKAKFGKYFTNKHRPAAPPPEAAPSPEGGQLPAPPAAPQA